MIILLAGRRSAPVDPPASSALSQVASGLSSGESTLFLGGGNVFDTASAFVLNWNQRCYYDPTRKVARFLGKAQQSVGGAAIHASYDEATNLWSSSGGMWGSETGHIYEQHAYDPATGRSYTHTQGTGFRLRYNDIADGLDEWTLTATGSDEYPDTAAHDSSGRLISGEGGCAWHPNLFGAAQGGAVVLLGDGFCTYNPANGEWSFLTDWPAPAPNGNTGDTPTCMYCSGLDAVFVANGNHRSVFRVTSGPTYEQVDDAPVEAGYKWSVWVDDPNEGETFYVLEKLETTDGSTDNRVWKYSNGSFSLQVFGHPFFGQSDGRHYTACALYGMGALWAIERLSNNSAQGRIWKPDA